MRSLLTTLALLFASVSLFAQKINLKVGDEFAIEATHKRVINYNNRRSTDDKTIKLQFKMLSSDIVGCRLQCILVKSKTYYTATRGDDITDIKFNSDSLKSNKITSSLGYLPLVFLERPFTIVINAAGKVQHLEGFDEEIQAAAKRWKLSASTIEDFEEFIKRDMKMFLEEMFFKLPEKRIAYGSTWIDSNKVSYSAVGIRGAILDITASQTGEKEMNGKYVLNETTGLLETAVTNTTDKYGVTHYQHKITYGKYTAAPIDTAWINMAMTLNYRSDAFYNADRKVDSLKAVAYFNAHDAMYANDKVYNSSKLYLLQHLTGVQDRKAYNYALLRMPNAFIADETSYLSNKLRDMMKIDADSAYNVIKYYAKHPEFEYWLQGNLANSFLRGENLDISKKVLVRLIADKDMKLQTNLKGLHLWVTLKDHPYDTDLLLKTYNEFLKMNDEHMIKGNGPRYALLTYKMLLKANRQGEAADLLKKVTQNLERYVADTLNQRRLIDKNKLAYANFLLYEADIKKDSVAAMAHFAKAAELSPISRSEWSYSGFNDHDYLNSKMSYREDYIKKLFANGPNETALKLFVEVVNMNVSQIDNMRTLYESNVKDKSFADFFKTNVVAAWQDAPDFVLTGIDGKQHKLSDYRGKWLLIDFWGTWCGPCLSEMPTINKFNDDINAGRFNNISLLTIASHDKEDEVKKYIGSTGFNMPVAMGDQAVINAYKITAFPTKLLIAPNGKMTSAMHGSTGSRTVIYTDLSWQNTVKKLSQLYVMN